MQLALSYFYQIRNFKNWMIPVSTAISDPDWFHDWAGPAHCYIDKRGILNGIRSKYINTKYLIGGHGEGGCPCQEKNAQECPFLSLFYQGLEKLNLQEILQELKAFGTYWINNQNIQHEPMIVFIVYEAPYNPCSERWPLLKFFHDYNIDCQELKYPIQDNYK